MTKPEWPNNGDDKAISAYCKQLHLYNEWLTEHYFPAPIAKVLVCTNCSCLIDQDSVDTHTEKCYGQYK